MKTRHTALAGSFFSQKAAQRAVLEAARRAGVDIPSGSIVQRLTALPYFKAGHSVGLYGAQGFEVDLAALHTRLVKRGLVVAYPRIEPGQKVLLFHQLGSPAELERSPRGLPRPPLGTPLVSRLDVIIAPGVAFSRAGERLGRGGGFYDATFLAHRAALRIGVTPSWGVVSSLPTDEWDVPVDVVVTEEETILTGARRLP